MESIDVMMAVYEDDPTIVQKTLDSFFSDSSRFTNKYRLIVYNDGSPGVGTPVWDFLKAAADVYMENPVNNGISYAWNQMMAQATADWVFNVDADCTAPENWLDRLVEEKNRTLAYFPNAKWICFKCIDNEGKMVFYYRNMNSDGSTGEVPEGSDSSAKVYNQFRRVTQGTSFCSLFNRKAYLEVGGPDNNIRKQWVDSDIGMSFAWAGYETIVNPNISFIFGRLHKPISQDVADYQYFRTKWRERYDREQSKNSHNNINA